MAFSLHGRSFLFSLDPPSSSSYRGDHFLGLSDFKKTTYRSPSALVSCCRTGNGLGHGYACVFVFVYGCVL